MGTKKNKLSRPLNDDMNLYMLMRQRNLTDWEYNLFVVSSRTA